VRSSIIRVAASCAAALAATGALAACGDEKAPAQPAPSRTGTARDATRRAAEALAEARATAETSLTRAQAVCDRAVQAARVHSQELADRTEDVCETSLKAGRGGAATGVRAGEEATQALRKALDDLEEVGGR
jgi:hypothetical protein